MSRVPKFIRSDKVRVRNGDGQTMFIEKFKMIYNIDRKQPQYSGLIICYWMEGKQVKRGLFDENDLEPER